LKVLRKVSVKHTLMSVRRICWESRKLSSVYVNTLMSQEDMNALYYKVSLPDYRESRIIISELSVPKLERSANVSVPALLDNSKQFTSLIERPVSPCSKRLLCVPNAGGNSVFSEALSFEFIKKIFKLTLNVSVSLKKTEMELVYVGGSKITDFSFTASSNKSFGCSVTRAFNYYDLDSVYPDSAIERLLSKKLAGINESTRNVLNDQWDHQILHVWTTNVETAEAIKRVYDTKIDNDLKSDTLVIITVARTSYECLYRERDSDATRAKNMLGLH